jgi:hypothetical protein
MGLILSECYSKLKADGKIKNGKERKILVTNWDSSNLEVGVGSFKNDTFSVSEKSEITSTRLSLLRKRIIRVLAS